MLDKYVQPTAFRTAEDKARVCSRLMLCHINLKWCINGAHFKVDITRLPAPYFPPYGRQLTERTSRARLPPDGVFAGSLEAFRNYFLNTSTI